MADERDDEPEGWGVPFRIGAIAGIAVPVVLGVVVLAAGAVYDHTLRPKVAYTVTPQPAPGLEADIHAGTMDPEVAPPLARSRSPDRACKGRNRCARHRRLEPPMKRLLLILLTLMIAAPAAANLSPEQLAKAGAHPPQGAMLPAKLAFTDQRGERVTLGGIADGKPLVLLFVDYTCKHICGPGLTLSAKAMADSGLTIGRDYNFALVGMDPRDSLDQARMMQHMRLDALPSMERASYFLVGSAANVAAATKALGLRLRLRSLDRSVRARCLAVYLRRRRASRLAGARTGAQPRAGAGGDQELGRVDAQAQRARPGGAASATASPRRTVCTASRSSSHCRRWACCCSQGSASPGG